MRKRKGNRKLKIVLWVLALVSFCALLINLSEQPQGKTPVPHVTLPTEIEPNPYVLGLLNEYEGDILKLQAQTGTPGVAIAIVQDTSIIYLKGFGVKQVGTTDSVDVHTVFRLASVSKC